MAAAGGVVFRGMRELNRAFLQVERNVRDDFIDELKKEAEPVAASARSRISRYRGAQTSTIKPVTRYHNVLVRQGARKRTGLRGDFGALQMRHLIGALHEHKDAIDDKIDGWLDWQGRKAGF